MLVKFSTFPNDIPNPKSGKTLALKRANQELILCYPT